MCAMGGRRRRRSGSDYSSDEEFELGGSEDYDVSSEEEEMENSDALSDADGGAVSTSSGGGGSEVDDDEEDRDYELEEEDDEDFAVGESKRPVAKKKPLRAFDGEEVKIARGKPRGRPRKRAEREEDEEYEEEEEEEEEEEDEEDEEEYEDESDEDFAPDEEENEDGIGIHVKVVGRGRGSRGRRGRRGDLVAVESADEIEERSKERRKRGIARTTKRRRKTTKKTRKKRSSRKGIRGKTRSRPRKVVGGTVRKRAVRRRESITSDEEDIDFVPEDVVSDTRRDGLIGRRNSGNGWKRRRLLESPALDSDCVVLEHELACLPFMNANCKRRRTERVFEKEKGKGKEVEGSDNQVCGICLSEERKGVARGLLNSCSHYFCFACILEWSKVESRCPACKQRFTSISKMVISNTILGLKPTVVRVPKRDQVYQPSEEELWGFLNPYENVVCMVCLQGGDDGLMLLCDICDSPAHTYCVGLGREVPEGDWYCNGCRFADDEQFNSRARNPVDGQLSTNNQLPRPYHDMNARETSFGGVPSYANPDRPGHLHEILEHSAARGSDSGWSQTPLAENNVIARASGPSALTLSARRTLSNHIRNLFSNSNNTNRLPSPQSPGTPAAQFGPFEDDAANSELGQRRRASLRDDLIPECNSRGQRRIPCTSYEDAHL